MPAFAIRRMRPADREPVERVVRSVANFNEADVACALELVEAASDPEHPDYRILVAEEPDGAIIGYACYGPTPLTRRTWDLYWMATVPAARAAGVGRALHEAAVAAIRDAGGRTIRVETSSKETYGRTRLFFDRAGYFEAGLIRDFYDDGDDLLILVRDLEAPAAPGSGGRR